MKAREGLSPGLLRLLARTGLAEDLGSGDITSRAIVPARQMATGHIVARRPGVLAGLPVVRAVFAALSKRVRIVTRYGEGATLPAGQKVATVHGPLRALLAGERTALNFLSRLSGIATLTRRFARAARPYGVTILDTRKTTPLLRHLEKYAVRMGGGKNHRFGLFDRVLIKDNHIAAAGSLQAALSRARSRMGEGRRLEVEAQNLSQVRAALAAGADIIMLDNMSCPDMRKAIRLIGRRTEVEISGGIDLANVRLYSSLGPDFISVGALTHSAPALDFSFDVRRS